MNIQEAFSSEKRKVKKYRNNDSRLGDCVDFTMDEMIDLFWTNFWHINDDGSVKSDDDIISEILDYDIEEI